MNDTPRTDEENDTQAELAAWELLKECRRELAEMRSAAIHRHNGITATAMGWALMWDAAIRGNQSVIAELIEASNQRDGLAEALKDAMEHIPMTLQGPAREALAAVKGGTP